MSARILLVEDEFLIAMDVRMQLEAAGYAVVGPAASADQALDLLGAGPVDAAVLDMNLRGSTSLPVAERLAAAGTPFLFLSGNDANSALAAFADRTVITKPIDFAGLLGALETLLAA